MFPGPVERSFLDPEYSFDEYFQLHLFKQYLKNTFDVDKYNSTLTMSYDKIAAEWLHYEKLIQI